ncbi:hypothetical protein [Streptomyces beihaiensis]|uniref:Uncharacterized protein n=1 Tax=Streptomyces beihaiensis TaxID=2984495 RepID=A0ABT3TPX6_9ACTN|nr:hypothetical protein [Streptomyces beihaiensis]MCX3059092.1 hypothetical protein [Streptomyces beihaiensis]
MIPDEAAQVITSFYIAPQDGETWSVSLSNCEVHARTSWSGYVASEVRGPSLHFTYTRADDVPDAAPGATPRTASACPITRPSKRLNSSPGF